MCTPGVYFLPISAVPKNASVLELIIQLNSYGRAQFANGVNLYQQPSPCSGLLKNGTPIDFANPGNGSAGTRTTMARIINLINDLILRRDVSVGLQYIPPEG